MEGTDCSSSTAYIVASLGSKAGRIGSVLVCTLLAFNFGSKLGKQTSYAKLSPVCIYSGPFGEMGSLGPYGMPPEARRNMPGDGQEGGFVSQTWEVQIDGDLLAEGSCC